jgi:hypothetical protein
MQPHFLYTLKQKIELKFCKIVSCGYIILKKNINEFSLSSLKCVQEFCKMILT